MSTWFSGEGMLGFPSFLPFRQEAVKCFLWINLVTMIFWGGLALGFRSWPVLIVAIVISVLLITGAIVAHKILPIVVACGHCGKEHVVDCGEDLPVTWTCEGCETQNTLAS